jgi:rhodanese-related sulfurtransferase
MPAKSAMDLLKEAKQQTENLTRQQVQEALQNGTATLIDIREGDESLPYHKPEFDWNKRIILHCASGGRSALAATTLKQMGYENVAHMDGGIKAWKEAGMNVEE